jgi:hypothetical protein
MMIPGGLPSVMAQKYISRENPHWRRRRILPSHLLITTTEQMLVPLPEEYDFTLSREV